MASLAGIDGGLEDALDLFGADSDTCNMFGALSADMMGCFGDTLLQDAPLAELVRDAPVSELHHGLEAALGTPPPASPTEAATLGAPRQPHGFKKDAAIIRKSHAHLYGTTASDAVQPCGGAEARGADAPSLCLGAPLKLCGGDVLPGTTSVAILDADLACDADEHSSESQTFALTHVTHRSHTADHPAVTGPVLMTVPTPGTSAMTVPTTGSAAAAAAAAAGAGTTGASALCSHPGPMAAALASATLAIGSSPRASDSLQSMQSWGADEFADSANGAAAWCYAATPAPGSGANAANAATAAAAAAVSAPASRGVHAVPSANSIDCASVAGSPKRAVDAGGAAEPPAAGKSVDACCKSVDAWPPLPLPPPAPAPQCAVGAQQRRTSSRARRATSVYAPYQLGSPRGKPGGRAGPVCKLTPNPNGHACTSCGATTTPVWRAGPAGPKTLCNACGVRYMKHRK